MGDNDEYSTQSAAAWAEREVLVRRFQSLSGQAWESRRSVVLEFFGALVTMASDLEQKDLRQLPDLPSFAFADVFAVLSNDVLVALQRRRDVGGITTLLAGLTRLREATR